LFDAIEKLLDERGESERIKELSKKLVAAQKAEGSKAPCVRLAEHATGGPQLTEQEWQQVYDAHLSIGIR
jgi:hypothetical protein